MSCTCTPNAVRIQATIAHGRAAPERTLRRPRQTATLCAVLAFASLVAGGMAFAQAQPYSAEAMWNLKRLGDPAISPDGRMAIVPVTTYDIAENESNTDLYLVPTKPGRARQLTSGTGSDTSPAWSPDGQLIAFVEECAGVVNRKERVAGIVGSDPVGNIGKITCRLSCGIHT